MKETKIKKPTILQPVRLSLTILPPVRETVHYNIRANRGDRSILHKITKCFSLPRSAFSIQLVPLD